MGTSSEMRVRRFRKGKIILYSPFIDGQPLHFEDKLNIMRSSEETHKNGFEFHKKTIIMYISVYEDKININIAPT